MIKIKATGKDKGKTMTPGKVYEVSDFNAKLLIESGAAVKATQGEKIGKVYTAPKAAPAKKEEDPTK